jgi:hypothetical protein
LHAPGELGPSYSGKAEALVDRLEAQFQSVGDPLDLAVVEIVNEAMRAYEYDPRKCIEIKQSLGGITGHQGAQDWQGTVPERYSEQGPETS